MHNKCTEIHILPASVQRISYRFDVHLLHVRVMHPRSAVVHHPMGFAFGRAVLFSLWFPRFAEGETGEPHASPVSSAADEPRRRMPHHVRPDMRKGKTNEKRRKGEVKLVSNDSNPK